MQVAHSAHAQHPFILRNLGVTDYQKTLAAMQSFTAQRSALTPDEIWLTEHDAVYTLGLNRKDTKPPTRSDIPLIEVDRGGKITYHGHGQIVIYLLLDLQRLGLQVRQLVSLMENAVIDFLASKHIQAEARADAPGVYVNGEKIAALGLRLKRFCSYHGLSLNVNMDLSPFSAIDPCGYTGLKVTQTSNLGIQDSQEAISQFLIQHISLHLQGAFTKQAACCSK